MAIGRTHELALVWGPTYEEMLHPGSVDPEIRARAAEALENDPLDAINLYNISWRDRHDQIRYFVVPKELTGVDANIVALYAVDFPTGSHKVGPTYSVTMEAQLNGEIRPGVHTLVFPSTGNYGIGGAWAGRRMGYDTVVVLPELMSQERFQLVESYGARYIKTPGCESSVKEIYDKCKELSRVPNTVVLNQFEAMANYRFHYYCTGNTVVELMEELKAQGTGKGYCSAFVSAMGSAGTIAAGDRVKQVFHGTKIVGLEPIQCPTLYANGYGDHDIQGIGDKHVTWIHNVRNMDALMCIDDMECKLGLQLLTDPAGVDFLVGGLGVRPEDAQKLSGIIGISGVCNLLGAIKTAKFYDMGPDDVVVTVFTDGIDRYRSVVADLAKRFGRLDAPEARKRHYGIFVKAGLDYIQEGTALNRARWHNLKYFTWVEQHGKSVEALNAQKSPSWWEDQQALVCEIDEKLRKVRLN
ncbi:MAG TPA: pyridoxal-phosphate dependent enzyme [Firmicutes bacterium]|nr:pyridoxal-phosphate dependent enzyme [Candidatus Fermentithermobacillaceae bacterium]